MLKIRVLSCVVALAAAVAVWGSADVVRADHISGDLVAATSRLSIAAERFHRIVHFRTGFSHIAGDAHRLADQAAHLHRSIELGADPLHVRRDLDRVRSLAGHVRHELEHDHALHHDWLVTNAWLRVERSLSDVEYLLRGPVAGPCGPSVAPSRGPAFGYDFDRGRGFVRIGPVAIRF